MTSPLLLLTHKSDSLPAGQELFFGGGIGGRVRSEMIRGWSALYIINCCFYTTTQRFFYLLKFTHID